MPFARSFQTKMNSEVSGSTDENRDNIILELATDFAVRGRYPPGRSKDKKRAVREYSPLTTVQLLHTNMTCVCKNNPYNIIALSTLSRIDKISLSAGFSQSVYTSL